MESKVHFRKRSEMSRTRMLSDFYFENKYKKKRSSSLVREKSPVKETFEGPVLNCSSIFDELGIIQKHLSNNNPCIRNDDLPMYQAFASIIDSSKANVNISVDVMMKLLKSADFHKKVQEFRSQVLKKSHLLLAVLKSSLRSYNKVQRSLYFSQLSKKVSCFIENLYKSYNIDYKPIRFIDYFESLQSPSYLTLSTPLNWSKLFTFDLNIETTKDDEENLYINTVGDDKEYETFIETEQVPVIVTEPDSKETLVSMFFQKHESKNPYVETPNHSKAQLPSNETRSDKWNKYFRESIYLKKLGQDFVQFILRSRKTGDNDVDLVTWVYKSKNELIAQFLSNRPDDSDQVSELKQKAMVQHLGDKKTLRDLFKNYN